MTLTLYGISNCDTVRKARQWLDRRGIAYRFHDLRQDGLDTALLRGWLDECGWENVVNRRSTSWRALPAGERERMDTAGAERAILAAPTLARRPILQGDGLLELGFSAARYEALHLGAPGVAAAAQESKR